MAAPALTSYDRVLDGLSSAQLEAVTHGAGPLLIVAGAGTGKTTVLTRRIAHLITSKQARPEEILALTFTDKAAREMAERVDQLIPYGYAETWIGTFHAFGDSVLREGAMEAGLNPEFRVLTRPEQIIFLRERLWKLPLERFRPLGDPTRNLVALLTLVSRAKDEDVSPEAYQAWAEKRLAAAADPESASADAGASGGPKDPHVSEDDARRHAELAAFYARYQELLGEAGAIDFGDQIGQALAVLRSRPALLAKMRARYRYILVDEFQDTNHAQLELVRLVANPEAPNITVVGDDDQAIYRWRGAAAGNLLAFRQLYPGARQVVLTENHRSTQVILDAAARLISYNNPFRLEVIAGIDKRLRSERKAGPPVRHVHYDTVSAEADGVAAMIDERLAQGFRPRDLAILVRSNNDADPFLRALNVRGLPHRFTGNRGLYSREEVRILVSFLRVLANPDDSVPVFHLAGSEMYRVPGDRPAAPQPLRRTEEPAAPRGPARVAHRHRARRRGRGGAGGRGAPPRRPRPRGRGRAAPAHRRGALSLPAGVGAAGAAGEGVERGGRGAGQEHLAVLRRREGLRRLRGARPGAGVRRPPRPAARGGRRPRGGGGRSRRRRDPRPHRAQGEGAGVPGRVPRRLRRAALSRKGAARSPGAAGGPAARRPPPSATPTTRRSAGCSTSR